MNPEQMGLMAQPGPQQGMPPGQPGPEAGMPPEGMPQEGMPPEEMPPEQPSQPVPDLSEEEMQSMYEAAYGEMSILLDTKETFDATRKMLSEAGDMMPEQFGMMTVGVVARLEQDFGPIPFEVLTLLIEHLLEESEDRWGVKMSGNEQDRAGAAFFGMYFKSHPDRIPWTQEEVEQMLAEEGGEEMPEEGGEEAMQPEEEGY